MRHSYAANQGPPVPAQAVTARHARWYRGAIVRGARKVTVLARRARDVLRRAPRASGLAIATGCALAAAGCGSSGASQDAGEPSGRYAMRVVHPIFPAQQSIARETRFILPVRNVGLKTVPNVAVTINSFDYTSTYPELAADKRPVWVIERGPGAIAKPPVESEQVDQPGSGQTAYVNTWALGALAPGQIRTFVWRVVPVKAGHYIVQYTVSPDLAGKAKARGLLGGPVRGHFAVYIAPAPKLTHVNPNTGRVEEGAFPISP